MLWLEREVVALDGFQNPELDFRFRGNLLERLPGIEPCSPETFTYGHKDLADDAYAKSLQYRRVSFVWPSRLVPAALIDR